MHQEFFLQIVPQLLALLAAGPDAAPPAYLRAAAFSISRLLAEESRNREESLGILLPHIHQPFLGITTSPPGVVTKSERPSVTGHISTLRTILINTDPSPALLSAVFTPVLSALYAILGCLDLKKTADPALRETVRGLLGTWSRIVPAQEMEQVCWNIVEGEGGYWKVDVAGEVVQTPQYFFRRDLARRKVDPGVTAGLRLPKISRSLLRRRWKKLKVAGNWTWTPTCLTSDPTLPISSSFSRQRTGQKFLPRCSSDY